MNAGKFREALIWSSVRELLRIGQNPATARLTAMAVLDTVEEAIRQDERERITRGAVRAAERAAERVGRE